MWIQLSGRNLLILTVTLRHDLDRFMEPIWQQMCFFDFAGKMTIQPDSLTACRQTPLTFLPLGPWMFQPCLAEECPGTIGRGTPRDCPFATSARLLFWQGELISIRIQGAHPSPPAAVVCFMVMFGGAMDLI